MKFTGDLENFQPSSVLQWIEADRLSGVLALQTDSSGYRLRFAQGQLVATSRWPAEHHLIDFLQRHRVLDKAPLEALYQEARGQSQPLSELLATKIGLEATARLMRERAREIGYGLLQESRGRFFFADACHPLPRSLETPLSVAALVMESVRQQDEESRLQEWMPDADQVLRPAQSESSQPLSDLQLNLIAEVPNLPTREQLEKRLPFETHEIRLDIARLIRDGYLVRETANAASLPDETETMVIRREMVAAREPTPEELPFLTTVEYQLLQQLETSQPLDEALRAVDHPTDLLLAASEILQISGLLATHVAQKTPNWKQRAWLGAAAVVTLSVILGLAVTAMTPRQNDDLAPVALPTPPKTLAPTEETEIERKALGEPGIENTGLTAPPIKNLGPSVEEQFQETLRQARRALETNRDQEAMEAIERAAGLKPGDPEVIRLWRSAQEQSTKISETNSPAEARNTGTRPEKAEPETTGVQSSSNPNLEGTVVTVDRTEATEPMPPSESSAANVMPAVELPEAIPNETGKLILNAIPYAFVRIDRVDQGATPLRLDLPPGSYEVEIYRADFETLRRTVVIESGEDTLETFTLSPLSEEDL